MGTITYINTVGISGLKIRKKQLHEKIRMSTTTSAYKLKLPEQEEISDL